MITPQIKIYFYLTGNMSPVFNRRGLLVGGWSLKDRDHTAEMGGQIGSQKHLGRR
jgi:hypothetical protein